MPAVRLSRYEFATVHTDACGRTFLDVPDPPSRRLRRDDAEVTAGEGDSLFALSWRAYESMLDLEQDIRPSGFYWVIAFVNGIVGLAGVFPDQSGRTIRLTSVEALNGEILAPPRFFSAKRAT